VVLMAQELGRLIRRRCNDLFKCAMDLRVSRYSLALSPLSLNSTVTSRDGYALASACEVDESGVSGKPFLSNKSLSHPLPSVSREETSSTLLPTPVGNGSESFLELPSFRASGLFIRG
jgi:hypothetical protein